MTDDDGDDDTMEGRLAHILESDAMDTVDLWLTIVACLAAIETLYVCALATYRYSRRIYHLPLQRWTIRVLLVGPVYSVLMWVALWYPSLDFYLAVPLGFYECYAFFGFYAMLACFADGEDRLATALGSLNPGPPTAYLYHPFGFNWCSCRCDNYSPLFWGNIHYAALPLKFGSSRELLRFLKRGVAQAMIVKPCSLLLMLTLEYLGYEELCNATRLLSVVSFWCVANSITQLYHAVLPRIRGLGGERLVVLLLVMVSVLAIQDVVISVFLIQEEAITAVVTEVTKRRNHRTLHRQIARYSHASLGCAEQGNWAVEAHTSTLMEALADAIGHPIQTSEPIVAWLARHAAWLLTRFRVRPNGKTSDLLPHRDDYRGDVLIVGELCWCLDPRPEATPAGAPGSGWERWRRRTSTWSARARASSRRGRCVASLRTSAGASTRWTLFGRCLGATLAR